MNIDISEVKNVLRNAVHPTIEYDSDTFEYILSIITENDTIETEDEFKDIILPFIESYDSFSDTETLVSSLYQSLKAIGLFAASASDIQLLDKAVSLATIHTNAEEIEKFWGLDAVRSKRNDTMQTSTLNSGKEDRRMAKEQKKFIDDLESKYQAQNLDALDNNQISVMTLPDFTGKSRDKDIQVSNITISFGGKLLLEGADLKFSYARRYGLIGKNGIGKTTLLKHMANFDIPGFPTHHRILHVKQGE